MSFGFPRNYEGTCWKAAPRRLPLGIWGAGRLWDVFFTGAPGAAFVEQV